MRLSRGVSRLAVEYFPADHLGYGRMGLQVHHGLERAGVQVDTDVLTSSADTVLFIKIPPLAKRWRSVQRPVIWTMYETTEVPVEFRDLDDFATVVVPCEANREAFSRWHPNVHTVPLAVDSRWKYRRPLVDGRFTVFASGSEKRKGLDLACEAFVKAFPGNRDVRLVLKTPTDMTFGLPSDPRFERVSGFLSAAEEVELYESANVYVGLSRGEGFGMMPLQAIVQGTPTVLSSGHGHAEFERFGIPVSTTLVEASEYRLYGDAGCWWESDVDDAVDKLRWVYDNYDAAVAEAAKNARKAKKQFTWDNTVAKLLTVLGDLGVVGDDPGIARRRLGDVPIVVTADVRADIGPHRVELQQGVEAWVHPDVKRVLRDNGVVTDESWHDVRIRRSGS